MTEYFVDLIRLDGEDFTSSNIYALGYDRASETLYVEFHSGAMVYSYEGVKESTYDMLVSADSVGSFYANHIKGSYTSNQVGTGNITERDNEEDHIQPNRKWLADEGGQMRASGGNDGIFALPDSEFTNTLRKRTYGVRWTNGALSFEPLFEAMSEADALTQFSDAIRQVMPDADVKVKAVVHYFD